MGRGPDTIRQFRLALMKKLTAMCWNVSNRSAICAKRDLDLHEMIYKEVLWGLKKCCFAG